MSRGRHRVMIRLYYSVISRCPSLLTPEVRTASAGTQDLGAVVEAADLPQDDEEPSWRLELSPLALFSHMAAKLLEIV